ncbi:MAG: hypothetical protein ACFFD4_25535 [Candidatus Odinarchaeota archaeon]
MILSTGAKAAKIFTIIMGLEFFCVAIWALLIQNLDTLLIASMLAVPGIIELFFWIYWKLKGVVDYDDEYMRFMDDNSRITGVFAGFLMFAQLAILDATTMAVIRLIDAFFIAFLTYLIVLIIHSLITFTIPAGKVNRGERNEKQPERAADQA